MSKRIPHSNRLIERFVGKRPLGNSGWQSELYVPLVQYGVLTGDLEVGDHYAYANVHDQKKAHKIIAGCIRYIFQGE